MLKFCAIALRNVFRNTRRTGFNVLVITFGAVALLVAGGFIQGNFEGLRERTIRNGLGHLQVFTNAYLDGDEERPLQHGVTDAPALEAWLQAQPHVKLTAGQVDFVGLVSNGDRSEPFVGAGVQPEREAAMGFALNLQAGEPLFEADGEDQALLGTGLAATMKARVGDVLTILGTTSDGALNAVDVRVVGLYSTGIKEFDARALKVPLRTAQRLLGSERVTKVIVKLDATRHTDEVAAALRAAGAGSAPGVLGVRTWRELATFYTQVVGLYSTIFVFLGVIIVVLVVLSSANTMMMSVLERVAEIGTLLAIGARRWQVLVIFVLEGLLIGCLGGLVGLAAGYGAIAALNAAHITLPPPPSFSTGVPLLVKFVPGMFAAVFGLLVSILSLAALLPAARGARLSIVEALGHV
ncbi:MAG: ABC transporter permease [Vicinamibacteria bacterium]